MKITIIDSSVANLGSIRRTLDLMGTDNDVSSDPNYVADAKALMLPGVGAFSVAIDRLRTLELDRAIYTAVERGAWILGICLGMQLLATSSNEHGYHVGLGLIPGTVNRLEAGFGGLRVPNVGWRSVHWREGSHFSPPWTRTPNYYFAHSYHVVPESRDSTIGTMRLGSKDISVSVRSGRIFGVQFHPEKSQAAGLHQLRMFSEMLNQ